MSARLVGRAPELELLNEALQSARRGQARVLVLSGEAGVGKTRLLQEFTERASTSSIVARGRCIEQTDGDLTYAPIVGVIRDIVRQRGMEHFRALLDPATAADLSPLVPSFFDAAEREPSRVQLFQAVLSLVDALAVEQPVVLLVEDTHWSDPATRDLLLFLASNLEGSGAVLVITLRDSGPSSAMTAWRIALMRLGYAFGVRLAPFTMDQTGEQLEEILGARPSPGVLRAVHERSGGIPLFSEMLIGSEGAMSGGVSGDLRELITADVRQLPYPTQELLHAAAVGGISVDADLLAAVAGIDAAEVTRRMRAAVELGILTAGERAYRFRHELLREVVRDGELLPGERASLHRAYAVAMESNPDWDPERGRDGRIALHWKGALDHERALRSSWDAARRAHAAGAFAEELRMTEQVLSVWDRVFDPTVSIHADRSEVLETAVDAACWAAQSERGLALAEAALELLARNNASGPQRARMLVQRASLRQQLMLPGHVDDLADASSIDHVEPVFRAAILGQLARAQLGAGDADEAARTAAELHVLASTLNDPAARLESRATEMLIGSHDAGAPALEEVIAEAAARGLGWVEALGWMCAVTIAVRDGAYLDAIGLGRRATPRLRKLGLIEYSGAAVSSRLALAQLAHGQLDGALDTIREAMAVDPAPNGRAELLLAEADVHLAAMSTQLADRSLAEYDALVTRRIPPHTLEIRRAALGPKLARIRNEHRTPGIAPHALTTREIEVLGLIAEGLSNKEIASHLYISTKTASVHVSNILRKLDVPARGAAVALAYREAIIDLPGAQTVGE